MQLPEYLEQLAEYLPEETIENIVSIEESLALIQYEDHIDELNNWFGDYEDRTPLEQAKEAVNFYVETIEKVLKLQGITLYDISAVRFTLLVRILYGVAVLGTEDLNDIYEGVEFEEFEDNVEILAERLAIPSEINSDLLATLINDVDDETIAAILPEEEEEEEVFVDPERVKSVKEFIEKMRAKYPTHEHAIDMATDYIRSMNTVDFSLRVALDTLEDCSMFSIKEFASLVSILLKASRRHDKLNDDDIDYIKATGEGVRDIDHIRSHLTIGEVK